MIFNSVERIIKSPIRWTWSCNSRACDRLSGCGRIVSSFTGTCTTMSTSDSVVLYLQICPHPIRWRMHIQSQLSCPNVEKGRTSAPSRFKSGATTDDILVCIRSSQKPPILHTDFSSKGTRRRQAHAPKFHSLTTKHDNRLCEPLIRPRG